MKDDDKEASNAPEQQKGAILSPYTMDELMEGFTIEGDDQKGHSYDIIVNRSSLLLSEILNAPISIEAKLSNCSVVVKLLLMLNIINQQKADHIMAVIKHNENKRNI